MIVVTVCMNPLRYFSNDFENFQKMLSVNCDIPNVALTYYILDDNAHDLLTVIFYHHRLFAAISVSAQVCPPPPPIPCLQMNLLAYSWGGKINVNFSKTRLTNM